MANNSNIAGAMQPNNAQYQTTGDANAPQPTINAAAARAAEAGINNCLGAGWAAVGSPGQASSNPPGVGAIPRGATPLRSGRTPILPPQGRTQAK